MYCIVKVEQGPVHQNLMIWNVENGDKVASFTQKSQSQWYPFLFYYCIFMVRNVQWTQDEAFCARSVSSELHVYAASMLDKQQPTYKLKLDALAGFSVSPGKSPHVAVFIPERKVYLLCVRKYI